MFEYFFSDLFTPVNMFLLGISAFLIYKIVCIRRKEEEPEPPKFVRLPKMKKRDFTVQDLREFDGKDGKRILLAVNGKVFDVTNNGRRFYGPDGPYGAFAGRDASRALGTFDLDDKCFKETYDDLSDLTSEQMNSIKEWELQMAEKYDYVGRLLAPGEQPAVYSDGEDQEGDTPIKKESKPISTVTNSDSVKSSDSVSSGTGLKS